MSAAEMASIMGMHRAAADCECAACGHVGAGRAKFYSHRQGLLCEACVPAAFKAHQETQGKEARA